MSYTWFWQVGSGIYGLLPRGGSKGPCLDEVPHRQKRSNFLLLHVDIFNGQAKCNESLIMGRREYISL